jgi:hypothetical protein
MRLTPLAWSLGLLACAGAETPAIDSVSAAMPNIVTITASDFILAAPDTIPSGMTSFHLVTTSGLHHAMVVRIDGGKTYDDFMEAVESMMPTDPFPEWLTEVGGPNPSAIGDTTVVTHDLDAGTYALLCVVDVPDRVPHIARGMVRPLTVVPASRPSSAPPTSDVAMTLVDYGFEITPALTPGTHVIKVTNTAQQPHEFFIARLDSGRTMADVGQWAATYTGPFPGTALGGLAPMAPGGTGFVRVRLTPGNYLLLCFVPDAKDGKLHLEHGMAKEFTIQ